VIKREREREEGRASAFKLLNLDTGIKNEK
jgi:hypothetical protein